MNLPHQVTEILDALLLDVKQSLKDNLTGFYLRGSLAFGDFIPQTSDIDVLVVTEDPVDEAAFDVLAAMHAQMAQCSNPFANRMEAAYIDRTALRRFQSGLRHPTLGQGETLAWSEHHTNWILERWTVREHGVTLFGPAPKTLIDSVSADELCRAVHDRLPDWVDWAQNPDDPDWRLPRSHKAYVVETMSRALYTLERKELSSKSQAVTWALDTLPDPWRATVERSQSWREDDTVDPEINPEIRRFILWVGSL